MSSICSFENIAQPHFGAEVFVCKQLLTQPKFRIQGNITLILNVLSKTVNVLA